MPQRGATQSAFAAATMSLLLLCSSARAGGLAAASDAAASHSAFVNNRYAAIASSGSSGGVEDMHENQQHRRLLTTRFVGHPLPPRHPPIPAYGSPSPSYGPGYGASPPPPTYARQPQAPFPPSPAPPPMLDAPFFAQPPPVNAPPPEIHLSPPEAAAPSSTPALNEPPSPTPAGLEPSPPSPQASPSPSPSPEASPSPSPGRSPEASPSARPSLSPEASPSPSPSPGASPSPSPSPGASPSPSPVRSPGASPSPRPSPSPEASLSPSPSPEASPSSSPEASRSPSPEASPSASPSPEASPSPSPSPEASPSRSPSPEASPRASPSPGRSPGASPSPRPSPSPEASPSPSPSASPGPSPRPAASSPNPRAVPLPSPLYGGTQSSLPPSPPTPESQHSDTPSPPSPSLIPSPSSPPPSPVDEGVLPALPSPAAPSPSPPSPSPPSPQPPTPPSPGSEEAAPSPSPPSPAPPSPSPPSPPLSSPSPPSPSPPSPAPPSPAPLSPTPPSPSPPSPSPPSPAPPPSSAGYFELIETLTAPNVALAMANIPYTRRYWFLERAYGPGEPVPVVFAEPNTGTLNLDTGEKLKYNAIYNPGCSGTIILPDGQLHTFGGDVLSPVRNLQDGRNKIMAFNAATSSSTVLTNMQWNRWYPSPIVLSSGKVLIVGGSNACLLPPTWPFAELWDPAAPASPTVNVTMPANFVKYMGLYNWYPFMQLLANGDILWFVEKGGAITDGNFNHIVDLPPFPASITHCTMFPKTSSISVLAMGPPTYDLSFVIFGGGDCNGSPTTQIISSPAASTSLRLDITKCGSSYCFTKGWEVEDMLGVPRVMGDSTLLPNGKVLLHGGAQFGGANAGAGWSTKANFQSLMYDPYKPVGQRYSKMDFAPIARVYHSANCLDPSGKVLVAGCENCGAYQQLAPGMSLSPDTPLEHRLEWAVPAEIAPGVNRPAIFTAPGSITRGSTITVSYTYPGGGTITGAALAAPCACTHSLNMNQRVIFLEAQPGGTPGQVLVEAPPPGLFGQALLGPHLLFLLGAGGTYSEGVWVTVAA